MQGTTCDHLCVKVLACALVSFSLMGCQCGFHSVGECPGTDCMDAGARDAGQDDVGAHDGGPDDAGEHDAGLGCDGGTPNAPHLCLAPAQPASCPTEFPTGGNVCSEVATCDYLYPPGVAPSGCEAYCEGSDGGLSWNVPLCF
jgi:hypothetical protein